MMDHPARAASSPSNLNSRLTSAGKMQARVPRPRCWAELKSNQCKRYPGLSVGDRGTIPDIAFTDLDVSG